MPMNLAALFDEEKLLLHRLTDMVRISEKQKVTRFSAFLNERQQAIAQELCRQNHVPNTLLFGGYSGAVRNMCGFFAVYDEPEPSAFPIRALTLTYPENRTLSHRDFLGTLMGMGITREVVGDILPSPGRCVLFVAESVLDFVCQEIKTVGNTGVVCTQSFRESDLPVPEFKDLWGTVSSPRMDSFVKLVTNIAREKSADLIRAGLVQRNYNVVHSISEGFVPGDTVTIRGHGKFIVDDLGTPNKKGRIPVAVRKFV